MAQPSSSQDKLDEYKHLEFVQRVLDPSLNPRPVDMGDGYVASHQMAAEVDEKGDWYVFPTIVNQGGELQQLDTGAAFDYAKTSGEIIPFDNKDDALDFSQNYKTEEFKNYNWQESMAQPNNTDAQDLAGRAARGEFVNVHVGGFGVMRINIPPSVAGIEARVDRSQARQDKWAGRGQAVSDAVMPHVDFMRENPELISTYLPLMLNEKFKEVKGFFDMATENMTPLQKTATATMALPVVGEVTGLASDAEMYITDPESRTVVNGLITLLSTIPGIPAASAVKANIDAWRKSGGKLDSWLPDLSVKPDVRQPPSPSLVARQGQFSGAPRGVDSDEKMGVMRQSLEDSMIRGVPGRGWYDRSSQSANDLTASRQGMRDLYTGNIAITSAGAAVTPNQLFAVKGYNQALTGVDIDAGRMGAPQHSKLTDLAAGKPTEFGPKQGPFFEATNVGNPGYNVGRPTNDLWMARAFDYRHPPTPEFPDGQKWKAGMSNAQHRFMDDEINYLVDQANTRKLGGFDDWTPERVQAAIWVDTKAVHEGTTIEEAMGDFSHNLDRYKTNINVESEPSHGLNHLAGARDNPDAAALMSDLQRDVLSDDQGRDLISLSAGGLTQPTETGFGYYKGGSVESDVVQTLSSPSTGTNVIDEGSKKLTEGIAATHGLLRGQDSVGYNFMREGANAVDRNAAVLDLGRVLDQDEMIKIGGVLEAEFGAGVIPTNTGNGINLLTDNWRETKNGIEQMGPLDEWAAAAEIDFKGNPLGSDKYEKKLAAEWQKRLSQITQDEFDITLDKTNLMHNSGNLVGDESFKPSVYMESIDQSGPGVIDRLDISAQNLAPRLEVVDKQLAEHIPDIGERSKVLRLTRQALIEGGFAKVRELIAQGLLPAFVAGIALSALSQQQPGDGLGEI